MSDVVSRVYKQFSPEMLRARAAHLRRLRDAALHDETKAILGNLAQELDEAAAAMTPQGEAPEDGSEPGSLDL